MIEKPNRPRRFRFTLRALLALMLLLAVPLTWFSIRMREAQKQKAAVEEFTETGGLVGYDYMYGDKLGEYTGRNRPAVPRWLRNVLGDDFFSRVHALECPPDFSNAQIKDLHKFKDLKYLDMGLTQVTDAGLAHLKGLPNLEYLELLATKVTVDGVEVLQKEMPNCKIVHRPIRGSNP